MKYLTTKGLASCVPHYLTINVKRAQRVFVRLVRLDILLSKLMGFVILVHVNIVQPAPMLHLNLVVCAYPNSF